jgi:hypothetical protein
MKNARENYKIDISNARREADGYTQAIVARPLAESRSAMLVAFAALVCAIGWLVTDVQINYAGHLSGLFYTGSNAPLPLGPIASHTWRVQGDKGYDGEFYHLIAHDPLDRRGFLAYVDSPQYRWRRIGVPGLAYLLAGGNDDWIDKTYVAVELVFTFLGSFWLSQYAQALGRAPVWGIAFLLIPGVAVSLDRMTVDLPIAAVTLAVLFYASASQPSWQLYAALIAAPLIRETGLLLILAWCLARLLGRYRRDAILAAACAIPTLAWYLYVALHTPPDRTAFLATYPFGGLITWTIHALAHPVEAYGPRTAAVLELVALAGIWLAFILSAGIAVRWLRGDKNDSFPEIVAIAFVLFTCLIGYQDIWASAYGIGRTLSPLLIALCAIALRDRRVILAMPLLLIVPRIALQFAAEIAVALGIVVRR